MHKFYKFIFISLSSIFLLGLLWLVWAINAARFIDRNRAEDNIKWTLNYQIMAINNSKYGGGVLIILPQGECIKNVRPCTNMATVPFSEESGLGHLPDDLEQFRLQLLPDYPKRSAKIVWKFNWICCDNEQLASGVATVQADGEVYLTGKTKAGKEIAFWSD